MSIQEKSQSQCSYLWAWKVGPLMYSLSVYSMFLLTEGSVAQNCYCRSKKIHIQRNKKVHSIWKERQNILLTPNTSRNNINCGKLDYTNVSIKAKHTCRFPSRTMQQSFQSLFKHRSLVTICMIVCGKFSEILGNARFFPKEIPF